MLREGKTTGAAADFKAASELAAELTAEEEQWRADYGLARTADAAGDKAGSNPLLHKAVDTIERMRKKLWRLRAEADSSPIAEMSMTS